MGSPVISIIIPIYNAASYLKRCIESVLMQSFSDFELLLIDDGSVDTSGAVCDEYALTDERIKVFHKVNGGVSSARNLGLNHIEGKWVTFVDSDDWLDPEYLDRLIAFSDEKDIDMIISGYNIQSPKGRRIDLNNYHSLFQDPTVCYTVPWGKLYKAEIINKNQIRFIENMYLGEDMLFLYTYMICSNTVYMIGNIGYHYNIASENSLSKKIFPIKNELFGYVQAKIAFNELIESKRLDHTSAIEHLLLLECFFIRRVLNALYYNKTSRKERMEILGKINIALYVSTRKSDSKKEQFFIWLLSNHCYICYDLIRVIIVRSKKLFCKMM